MLTLKCFDLDLLGFVGLLVSLLCFHMQPSFYSCLGWGSHQGGALPFIRRAALTKFLS